MAAGPAQQEVAFLPLPQHLNDVRKAAFTGTTIALAREGWTPPATEPRPSGPPDRLRIAILAPRVDVGGGARVLLEHANRLQDRGHAVTLLSPFPRPEWFDLRADFRHVPLGRHMADELPGCDVIICGYWEHVLPARAAGVAPVVHFEQGDFHLFEDIEPGALEVVKLCMDAADATTTVSARVAGVLHDRYGLEDVGVVHNAIDPAIFHPTGARRERPYVLCVGWDGSAFKGIGEVRQVRARLAATHPGLDVVWVTPRPPVEPMGEVVVTPTQAELADLYSGAAVYLCASHYESFPLPPLEAMACGTPVVTTDNVGVMEYAVHDDNALVVPIGDVEAMADGIAAVLASPELAGRLREGGLRTAASFTWDRIIAGLEERLRGIAAHRVPASPHGAWTRIASDATPVDDEATDRLERALVTSNAREIEVPVVRPAIDGHDVVAWETAARRPGGRGTMRVLARHRGTERGRLPYQAAIDALADERAKDALELFREAAARGEPRVAGACVKWIALCLFELYRNDEAVLALENGMRRYPDNGDIAYLAALIGALSGRAVDLARASSGVELVGEATRYADWFADPVALLAARVDA